MLAVALAGPPDGEPLFSHHGTPGAGEMFDPLVEVGAQRNLRHITYSRPGYGRSDRLAGRSVASCAADVAAIADALGYDRFYSVGGSGGAPHSIALAALLPDRVISAAAIASPAPLDAEGLDWTAGMAKENVAEVAAVRGSDDELVAHLEREAGLMLATSQDEVVTSLGDLVSEVDRRAIDAALAEFIVRETTHSLSAGVWGWFDDDRAILGNWGFELSDIGAHLRSDDGHLSLSLNACDEILDALIEDSRVGAVR